MSRILVLWATPRSTSTAFEWMMRMRGDMRCFHEPFGEAWYKGDDALWPRLEAGSERIPGLTFASVWQTLQEAAAAGPVFSKDFPHYIRHLWSDELLDRFEHSFLIRDPAKVITSMYRHWPDFLVEELGIVEQRELFDRLSDRLGAPPPVIDSDDLLENPAAVVEAWCESVGIPFLPEALSWEPGERAEVSWYDGGSWHENLRGSDGLKPQPREKIDLGTAPANIRRMHEIVLPHYRALHRHRLRVV